MYYIRAHGEISGPYTVGKLKNMQQSGEFSSAYEVSTDQRNWQPASSLIKSFRKKRPQRQSPAPALATSPEIKTAIEAPPRRNIVLNDHSLMTMNGTFPNRGCNLAMQPRFQNSLRCCIPES